MACLSFTVRSELRLFYLHLEICTGQGFRYWWWWLTFSGYAIHLRLWMEIPCWHKIEERALIGKRFYNFLRLSDMNVLSTDMDRIMIGKAEIGHQAWELGYKTIFDFQDTKLGLKKRSYNNFRALEACTSKLLSIVTLTFVGRSRIYALKIEDFWSKRK